MKKSIKIILLIGIGIAGMQFIRPREIRENRPVPDLAGVPAEVNDLLAKACLDCHSAGANLHWYDKIAPASYWVASHIRDGRAVFNFAGWDSLATPQQNAMLYYALNKALSGEMPLASYTAIHPSAKWDETALESLKKYLLARTPAPTADSLQLLKANEEYDKWQAGRLRPQNIALAPNGIAYIPDYRQWKAISTTERFDNNSLRIIFANEVALQAIESRQTNPWPDGAIFAKAAWKQHLNSDGSSTPGAFWQVEFMIKDARKYAPTKGWGWARWRDNDLKPYGKNAAFTRECISCHQPVAQNDFVFTKPLNDLNGQATAQPGEELPENPLLLVPLTTAVQPGDSTLSTLYGNRIAAAYASTKSDGHYPPGSVLYAVTWKRQPDALWFGANIPKTMERAERVAFVNDSIQYDLYQGQPLQKMPVPNKPDRVSAITGQRMAASP